MDDTGHKKLHEEAGKLEEYIYTTLAKNKSISNINKKEIASKIAYIKMKSQETTKNIDELIESIGKKNVDGIDESIFVIKTCVDFLSEEINEILTIFGGR